MGTISIADSVSEVDISRAQQIALGADFIVEGDVLISTPDPTIKHWPALNALGRPECNKRTECTGCTRITKLTSGVVATIHINQGDKLQPIGAFCTSEDSNQPFKSVFFSEK